MQMRLTVHGGAGEIGGNKILLEDGDARIWLDMGLPFGFGEQYFVNYLGPRDRFGLRDYLEFDLVPRIKGLYSKESLEETTFPYSPPGFSGVLLSHAHFDHSSMLGYVDEDIPVHLGECTRTILEAWAATSYRADLGEHDYKTFRSKRKIKMDGVEAIPVHVDHSVPAAYGYILHAPSGTAVYTGDLRRHGPHAEMTAEFIDAARAAKPDVLLCEGTRVDPADTRTPYSEKDVKDLSIAEVRKAKGRLAIVTFYPRDVDRMRTFHEVARATGRDFVLSAKAAHLLRALEKDGRIKVPRVRSDGGLLVYLRRLAKSIAWEEKLRDELGGRIVGAEYVKKHQGELLLQLDFTHFTELIDIEPKRGSIFIHSMSEPFEEDDIEDAVKDRWLDHFGLVEHQLHASGHLSRKELESMVKEIGAKKLVPIHTDRPEMFKDFTSGVIVPEKGKTISI